MKFVLAIVLLVLPSVALGAIVFGGADTKKVCEDVLVNGTVKQNVPDADDCSQYYVCSAWFQSKMKCTDGEHFDAAEEKCTDPCSAGCDTTIVCTSTSAPEEPTTAAAAATEDSNTEAAAAAAGVADETASAADDTAPTAESEVAPEIPASEAGPEASVSDAASADEAATLETAADDSGDDAVAASAAPEAADDAPAEPKAEEPAVEAEVAPAAEVATAGAAAAVTEAATEGTETTTAFWQLIANKFGNPPASIPGVTGTIPPNF